MIAKVVLILWAVGTLLWGFHIERALNVVNNHADICAKAINQEQYQIDVITQWIKGEK